MMSKSKTRLGLLALCATAAMAMMAMAGASGAQAAGCTAANPNAKPCWMLGGANVTANLPVTVNLIKDTLVKLLTTSGGTPVAIDCLEQKVTKAELLPEGVAHGTILFENCHTYLGAGEELSEPCKPAEPIHAGGTLEIALHEGEPLVKATGTEGKFTTLEFGEECSLPEEVSITGTGWILDCEEDPETELLTHLIEEGMAAALALGGLKFGKNPASIDGSLIVEVLDGGMQTFSILAD
jgi:hypothetical protein